jgi:1-deoxy-D-xylulose-5-phosphate reductoisomerase
MIEAHELFDIECSQIDIAIHPQSIIHSLVEFVDGAAMAQLSAPDMRLAVSYALSYPDRSPTRFGALDWTQAMRLELEPPDERTFRCLGLAYAAARLGGSAPTWLNAANEVAVAAFLSGAIPWTAIAEVNEEVLGLHDGGALGDIEAVVEADRRARSVARAAIQRRAAAA